MQLSVFHCFTVNGRPQGQIHCAFYSTIADNLARLKSFIYFLIVSRCLIEVKGIMDE